MAEEQQHKRRVRYKGTHPRNYKEKYKELDPEKYGDEIQKIIQKGKTPAGMHISIMVNEIL
ncbi:MAG: 16S rRNA (cytosine(1402)-N(4))-methyltransferase, partial [Clostridia bacterium]|nr:16S rRNA (cytosine(1402)-N(4))-methyltransferase [Clostridia bacterium]